MFAMFWFTGIMDAVKPTPRAAAGAPLPTDPVPLEGRRAALIAPIVGIAPTAGPWPEKLLLLLLLLGPFSPLGGGDDTTPETAGTAEPMVWPGMLMVFMFMPMPVMLRPRPWPMRSAII